MSLRLAFALSLLLHAAMIAWPGSQLGRRPHRHAPEIAHLSAVLVQASSPPAELPAQPSLRLPDGSTPVESPSPPKSAVERPRPRPTASEPTREKPQRTTARLEPLTGEAAQAAKSQIARELLYPEEAVRLGLEGEVLVQLFLDEAGDVIAARLERGSGHPLLDAAAVRAARTVRALPASAPREALLPVRFRLR